MFLADARRSGAGGGRHGPPVSTVDERRDAGTAFFFGGCPAERGAGSCRRPFRALGGGFDRRSRKSPGIPAVPRADPERGAERDRARTPGSFRCI